MRHHQFPCHHSPKETADGVVPAPAAPARRAYVALATEDAVVMAEVGDAAANGAPMFVLAAGEGNGAHHCYYFFPLEVRRRPRAEVVVVVVLRGQASTPVPSGGGGGGLQAQVGAHA